MFKKTTAIGMAACAAVLLGMASCGSKKAENTDSIVMPDTNMVDTNMMDTMPNDSSETVETPTVETVDTLPEAEKPGDDGYITTASGLKYKVIRKGTGATPNAKSIVKVNYEGKLASDGTVFDSSYQRGEPIDFGVGGVIPGWTEGLQLMQEGAEYEFYIPSNLAYGERGAGGGQIPPNADLIFKVELLQVK